MLSDKEQQLIKHYDSNPKYYSPVNEYLANLLTLRPGERLLDLGCGDGRLCQFIPDSVAYVGVDISQVRINIASQRYPNRTFVCWDIYDFLNNNLQFDTVAAFEILEHLADPQTVVDKCKTISRKIVASVPRSMPYEAHLQVYDEPPELGFDKVFEKNGHFIMLWMHSS